MANASNWSLGGEGKITWMLIANKSGAEKLRKVLYRWVIFLGEFLHCDYNFLKEIGKIRFNSVNSRKKCSKYGKKSTNFTNHKIEKKTLVQRYICVQRKDPSGPSRMVHTVCHNLGWLRFSVLPAQNFTQEYIIAAGWFFLSFLLSSCAFTLPKIRSL
jgi:hypothetical protein